MKATPVAEHLIYEQLNRILQLADTQALLEVVQVLAKQLGQEQIEGISISAFFKEKRQDIADQLVEDFGRQFPTLAEQANRAWKRLGLKSKE